MSYHLVKSKFEGEKRNAMFDAEVFTKAEERRIISTNKENKIMKKVILSILVAVAVFFVTALLLTLIRNMTFTETLSKPYNYFLAAVAFIGTFTVMKRKENK